MKINTKTGEVMTESVWKTRGLSLLETRQELAKASLRDAKAAFGVYCASGPVYEVAEALSSLRKVLGDLTHAQYEIGKMIEDCEAAIDSEGDET